MSSYATANNLYIIPVTSRVQPQVHEASASSQVTLCRLLPRPAAAPFLVQTPAQAPPQRIIPKARFVLQAPAPQRLFVETQASALVPTPEPSNLSSTQSSTATFTFANPTPAETEQRTLQPAISSLPPPNIISDRPTYRGERQVDPGATPSPSIRRRSFARRTIASIAAGKGAIPKVDVIDDDIQEDPCMLPHYCIPKKYKTNYVERMLYEKLQKIRNDSNFADTVIRRLWQDMLDALPLLRHFSPQEVEEIMDEFHGTGYSMRRRTLFFSTSDQGFTSIIRKERCRFQKAVENGLKALVADGIHKLPPEELGKDGQFYTIHGVCNAEIDVPLVHILTKTKNLSVYEKAFGTLKQGLLSLSVDLQDLRIIIDFERSALAAIKKHYPPHKVEGCSFHLAQAWNRKLCHLGSKQR